jgi:ribosomal protein S18 acetylase RimI-like enzyme
MRIAPLYPFPAPRASSERHRDVDGHDRTMPFEARSEVEVAEVDPAGPVARACLTRYFAELDERFASGFDPDAALPTDARVFLVARVDGEPVGCGALKPGGGGGVTEIKRMWVSPDARGLGVGRRLLAELEARAIADGAEVLRLDSNGSLVEAIALYRSAGYVEVEAFNDEPHATVWMAKPTGPTA